MNCITIKWPTGVVEPRAAYFSAQQIERTARREDGTTGYANTRRQREAMAQENMDYVGQARAMKGIVCKKAAK